jgi:DNA polymerase
MNNYTVKDLDLAGVKWEIADVPLALRDKWATAAKVVAQNNAQSSNDVQIAGISVVPPIAPISTVSQETAESMAARPTDIDNLIRMIGEFNHPLRAAATNTVLPLIAKKPNGLVIVTDVPGVDDDASGQILSGAVGELMDKMLAAIGMNREMVSIIPLVFWRTPGGRTPSDSELSLTRPFINRLFEFLQPKIILTLGASAAKEIADIKVSNAHGVLGQTENGTPVMPIYHPNYLLLKPSAKRDVWTALQELQNLLKNQ